MWSRWILVAALAASCGGDPGDSPPPDAGPAPAETAITEGPAEITSSRAASFTFTTSPGGAAFACRLDGAAFAACTSPHAVTVGEGEHVFEVRAAGDATPASLRWRVDLT